MTPWDNDRNRASRERLLWLHDRIRGGSFPNASRLCDKFGISETQAHRDVKALRDLGAPLSYDSRRGGFYYRGEFNLPDSFREDDTENSLQAIALAEESDISVQMRIPDTAIIELDSRVSAMELGKYIVSRAGAKNRFVCEFRNPDLFIGMILASGQNVKIIEPEWLKEKLLVSCGRLIGCNSEK